MGSSGSLVSKVGRVAIGLHYLLGKHNLLYIGDLNLPNCIPSRAPKFNKVLISRMEQLILEMPWYEMKLILSNKIISTSGHFLLISFKHESHFCNNLSLNQWFLQVVLFVLCSSYWIVCMEVGTTAKLANLIITNDPIHLNAYVNMPKSIT